MMTTLPTQKAANFRMNSSQNVSPLSSLNIPASPASMTRAMNSEIIDDPTLSITLELRPRP